MTDPLRALKLLPWRSLLLDAVLTIAIASVLEFLLVLGYALSSGIRQAISLLFDPPLGGVVSLLTVVAVAVGIGALAVYLLEKFQQQVIINTGSLWALVLCLLLALFLKSLLPVPTTFVSFSQTHLIGIILGVFWKGRPYWRWR